MESKNRNIRTALIFLLIIVFQNFFIIYKLYYVDAAENKDNNELSLRMNPETPEEIYDFFKKKINDKNFENLKEIIHSDGVYYFDEGRLKISDVNYSNFSKNNNYQTLVNGLETGKMIIEDNFSSAQGGQVTSSENPHYDMENWYKNDGFFKPGSKIIAVYYGKPDAEIQEEGSKAIIIELYKDGGYWKIYSVYNWVWSIE
jgi:hypothetical protein